MVSTVKAKPNHYERLGLAPGASDEDIARAFAREISPLRPRPVGEVAQITLAYETLRDPAKRRAYDESLAPKAEPAPSQWPREGWPFVASARVGTGGRPATGTSPSPGPERAPRPRPPAPAEPRTGAFVAASARTAIRPDARDDKVTAPRAQADQPRRPEPPRLTATAAGERAGRSALAQRLPDVESMEWKRPAMVAGGLFLAVALFGGWLGWPGDQSQDVLAADAVTLDVPEPVAQAAASPPEAAALAAEARPELDARAASATAGVRRAPPPSAPPEVRQAEAAESAPDPGLAQDPQTEAAQSGQSRLEDIAAGLAVAEPAPATASPAKLPLPDSVVARTIARIGYACGEVASASAVEGAAGVFKVTCTSGDAYRAAPIRGRYHFRRWDRR